jgi:hypothetical protein
MLTTDSAYAAYPSTASIRLAALFTWFKLRFTDAT